MLAATGIGGDHAATKLKDQTAVLGWLRGDGALHHGARHHDCRRGRQAAEPGARVPGP
jgi:hypothetical protein